MVIYFSEEDGCWIAHSLKTDQIGTGVSVLCALEDGLRAVQCVMKAGKEDPTIRVFRDAPKEIFDMMSEACQLPGEIYDIAHKRVHGDWPKDITTNFDSEKHKRKYVAAPPAELQTA